MSTIISIIVGFFKSLPAIERLLKVFIKTPQEASDDAVAQVREEIDEFRRTGRPPR